jgi:hypothetical protein
LRQIAIPFPHLGIGVLHEIVNEGAIIFAYCPYSVNGMELKEVERLFGLVSD